MTRGNVGSADDLVGVFEIARLFGVTRQRVDDLSRNRTDFPAPIATLRSGRVWLRYEVEAWGRKTGRIEE